MAILGAEPGAFARYEAGVRAEYLSAIPAAAFDAGRKAFPSRLVDAPIFVTPWFRDRCEAAARRNLRAALRWTNDEAERAAHNEP